MPRIGRKSWSSPGTSGLASTAPAWGAHLYGALDKRVPVIGVAKTHFAGAEPVVLASYIAAGLLWRDGMHDRSAAASILRGVLDLQYDDGPDSKLHGVWRRRQGETEHDSNWREFVGCGLILILETFPSERVVDALH